MSEFFTVKLRNELRSKLELKLPSSLEYVAALPCTKKVCRCTSVN